MWTGSERIGVGIRGWKEREGERAFLLFPPFPSPPTSTCSQGTRALPYIILYSFGNQGWYSISAIASHLWGLRFDSWTQQNMLDFYFYFMDFFSGDSPVFLPSTKPVKPNFNLRCKLVVLYLRSSQRLFQGSIKSIGYVPLTRRAAYIPCSSKDNSTWSNQTATVSPSGTRSLAMCCYFAPYMRSGV